MPFCPFSTEPQQPWSRSVRNPVVPGTVEQGTQGAPRSLRQSGSVPGEADRANLLRHTLTEYQGIGELANDNSSWFCKSFVVYWMISNFQKWFWYPEINQFIIVLCWVVINSFDVWCNRYFVNVTMLIKCLHFIKNGTAFSLIGLSFYVSWCTCFVSTTCIICCCIIIWNLI